MYSNVFCRTQLEPAKARMKSATAGSSHHLTVTDRYLVGNFIVAVYESFWHIGQVEAEEHEEEMAGSTLIKYMNGAVHNKFVWGVHEDIYITENSGILLTEFGDFQRIH